MVYSKKGLLLSLLLVFGSLTLFMCTAYAQESEDNFIEKKPAKRSSLSKSRREAIDTLESLGHKLAEEIEVASRALRDVMSTARDIIEGDAKTQGMKLLQADRVNTLNSFKSLEAQTRARISSLRLDYGMCKEYSLLPLSHGGKSQGALGVEHPAMNHTEANRTEVENVNAAVDGVLTTSLEKKK